jgi:nucleoside-diphosphate-sugar epimerase
VRAPLLHDRACARISPAAALVAQACAPFASIRNRRSLIYLGNLVSLLRCCAEHPGAAGKIFLAADGEDLSTPELVRRMGAALGRMPRLVPFPVFLLPSKLASSLAVDASNARDTLAWQPPHAVDDGLARTAAWYHQPG